jgi:uncharacterized protein
VDRLSIALALSTLADAAGIVVFAWLRGPARWIWAAVASGLWLLKLVTLGVLGLEPLFGTVHLLWLDVILVVPLAGLLLVVRARWAPLRAAGALAVLLAPAGAYASFVEPSRLVVTRVDVPLAPERGGGGPLRVAVLSDLQFERVTGHEREAVDRALALKPDLVLLPGDVHQGSDDVLREELPEIRTLLRRLRAPGGVFFVGGDQERGGEAELVTRGTGVRLLEDEIVRTRVAGRAVTIGGIGVRYDEPRPVGLIRTLERAPGDRDVRLLLAHRPDAATNLATRSRIDLVVAGHTHGGQLQLPLVGPLFTASRLPREVGGGGLHDLGGGRRVFVSRGVGVERGQAPRMRFLAPPEVALLTLAP